MQVLFQNKTDSALFRYFEKCCSDVVDTVPLKWYKEIIKQSGYGIFEIEYFHDLK